MRLLILLAVAVTMASAAQVTHGKPDIDKEWQDFKGKHGKKYKHAAEEAERRKIWEAKRDRVAKHNQEAAAGLHTYKMAINSLSDLTPAELANLARTFKNPATKPLLNTSRDESNSLQTSVHQVASVDLRNDPCMPPIKDQNLCGACWAFAATTPVEWALCKKNNNNLVQLSEQQLVDCSADYGNNGCEGGFYTQAWSYVKHNGQAKGSDYPYTATNMTCKYDTSKSAVTVTGFNELGNDATESGIRAGIDKIGPVAAALDTQETFFNYRSGVFTDSTCKSDGETINHGVVLVGYGSLNLIDYWILRNSWATTWGDMGYMLIRRGTNECNIESYVAYPTFGGHGNKPPLDGSKISQG